MSILESFNIGSNALRAHGLRLDIHAKNVSNIDTPNYVRKIPVLNATDPGQFVSLIALDMDAYAAKYGSNAVKKTLTIPAWLNTFVEQNGISCSKVLQDALSKMAQAR